MVTRSACMFLMAATLTCGSAAAHKINPLQDKYKQDSHTVLRKVAEPVHEEMTQLARACQQTHPGPVVLPLVCSDRSTRSKEPRGNKYDSLVRGVWWSDDPNQRLFAAKQAIWLSWMSDARRIALTGKNWKGRETHIGPDYKMTYRSHYGDLQFLHSMASSDGESAAATRQAILAWAEFTYTTATGRLDLETMMDQVEPKALADFFPLQSGWTVNHLFAPHYRLPTPQHNRLMAAGALLHMVQDSYSGAHTERSDDPTSQCPAGRVVQFYSYTHQDPDKHAAEDLRKAWQARSFTAAQDPVNVSATLLAFVKQKTPWQTVQTYLADTVFCIDEGSRAAGPGPFVAGTGRL